MKDRFVEEWLKRGERDFEVAKIVFNNSNFYDEVILLLQQSMEKYIKGFLISKGWHLKKIHDLETLFSEAGKYNQVFYEYLDFGRILTGFYYENRYPSGESLSATREETLDLLKKGNEVLNIIKQEIRS